jgi:hypothetical protein
MAMYMTGCVGYEVTCPEPVPKWSFLPNQSSSLLVGTGHVCSVLYNKPLLRGCAASSSLHQVWGGKERRRRGEGKKVLHSVVQIVDDQPVGMTRDLKGKSIQCLARLHCALK